MSEKRKEQRHPLAATMKISHPDIGDVFVKTKDLSEHGLFVLADPQNMPPVGSIVKCQVQRGEVEMPVLSMKIVRAVSDGLGLLFVDE